MGYHNWFISAAFVGLACAVVSLVTINYGKVCRVHSQKKYWQIVQENLEKDGLRDEIRVVTNNESELIFK